MLQQGVLVPNMKAAMTPFFGITTPEIGNYRLDATQAVFEENLLFFHYTSYTVKNQCDGLVTGTILFYFNDQGEVVETHWCINDGPEFVQLITDLGSPKCSGKKVVILT